VKLRINVCHIYLLVVLLCAVDGWLYSGGGFLAQGLQYVLILMSLYYTVYANVYYKLPVYFKALNVLLIMFTIYGILLLISGEKLYVMVNMREVANTRYLKMIYKSLLPIYVVDGVTHYVVDHRPTLFWKTTSESLSAEFVKYIDFLIEGTANSNPVLSKCHNFEKGEILDDRINKFQGRG